jgi:hypothetical protein
MSLDKDLAGLNLNIAIDQVKEKHKEAVFVNDIDNLPKENDSVILVRFKADEKTKTEKPTPKVVMDQRTSNPIITLNAYNNHFIAEKFGVKNFYRDGDAGFGLAVIPATQAKKSESAKDNNPPADPPKKEDPKPETENKKK